MSALAPLTPHKLTVEQVLAMVSAGILDGSAPVELIDGVLTTMAPQGPAHTWLVTHLAARLRAHAGADATVLEEKPVRLDAHSLPEPDVAVLDGPLPRDRHPAAADCRLLVQVAVSSQRADAKAELYARAGVAEVWIVDAPRRRLTRCTGPLDDGTWRSQQVLGEADDVDLPDGARTTVGALLGG